MVKSLMNLKNFNINIKSLSQYFGVDVFNLILQIFPKLPVDLQFRSLCHSGPGVLLHHKEIFLRFVSSNSAPSISCKLKSKFSFLPPLSFQNLNS
jgi:hypothetical protein